MESYKGDQSDVMDRLLRKQLRSGGAPQCGGFDPDLAGAYFEKALSSAEEQTYQLHLADCRSCRKLYTEFFLFASEAEPESLQESAAAQLIDIPLKAQETVRKPFFSLDAIRAWIFGPQLRWVLPTALVFVVAGTVWFSTNRPMLIEPSPTAVSSAPEMPALPPAAQSEPASESKDAERLPSDAGSDREASAPLSVSPKPESKDVKTLPSADLGKAQSDAAPRLAYQQPSNVLRQFERGAPVQNEPAPPEAETARRNADARKGAGDKEAPADLAAQNSFGESAKSVAKPKVGSVASQPPPPASAAGRAVPAEPSKEAPKPVAPSVVSRETAENKASGSIQGLIIDGAGQIVPGAQVILRDSATGAQRYANADKKGGFSFTGLPSGNYLVQAQTETLRKEQSVSLDSSQTISNFRMQFDASPQIALNADDLKKRTFERDKLNREERADQEKAKEKNQEGAFADKADENQSKSLSARKKDPSSNSSGAGARTDKDSAAKKEDVVANDRWRIDGETGAAKAPAKGPAKTEKQSRSKTGFNNSTPSAVAADAVEVKDPAKDGKSAKPTKTKRVGDKNFVFLEGAWTDEEYLLKDKIKDLRIVKLEYKSEAYNKILKDLPALKPYFQLGEQVIVVYKGAVYTVAKKL